MGVFLKFKVGFFGGGSIGSQLSKKYHFDDHHPSNKSSAIHLSQKFSIQLVTWFKQEALLIFRKNRSTLDRKSCLNMKETNFSEGDLLLILLGSASGHHPMAKDLYFRKFPLRIFSIQKGCFKEALSVKSANSSPVCQQRTVGSKRLNLMFIKHSKNCLFRPSFNSHETRRNFKMITRAQIGNRVINLQ